MTTRQGELLQMRWMHATPLISSQLLSNLQDGPLMTRRHPGLQAAAVAAFLVPPRFVPCPLMKLSSAGVPHAGEHSKGRGINMAGKSSSSNEDEELVF